MKGMPLEIGAAGLVFPGGPGVALADIALQTQTALVRQHPYYVDRCGSRARVSVFPDTVLPFDSERWWALLEGALDDLAQYQAAAPDVVCLTLPDEDRPGVPNGLAEILRQRLHKKYPTLSRVGCFQGGHAAAGQALAAAAAWLERHATERVMLAAVDCPLASDSLSWLEARGLLHGSHQPYEGRARANPYGRIPGEGAAAVSLQRSGPAGHWARLIGLGRANEAVLHHDTRPCLGEGMSEAARNALEHAGRTKGLWRYKEAAARIASLCVDLNGEPYRGDQFGFCSLRLASWFKPDMARLAPPLVTGDLGSASLTAHLALLAWRLRYAMNDDWHLILSGSDDAERAAVVLGSPEDFSGQHA